ncbi:MAG: acyl-CoA dehydrogenase family protein [Mycobacterium sp.]|nr:acyl-CoA dehydrogenase family protein [Mycobacterium sp.]
MSSVALERTIFDDEHVAFRDTARAFAEREVAPRLAEWAQAGRIDRDLFRKAGELGLIGTNAPEEYNGGGADDFRFNAIVNEELCRVGALSVAMLVFGMNDLVLPYLTAFGNHEQKQRWLAPLCVGEKVGAIAFTEPNTGSDLPAMNTSARAEGNGNFVVNGSKVFISNGMLADFVVTAVRTDPDAGRQGFSVLVIETDTPGFTRSQVKKIGLAAQDTAELVFEDVVVPAGNVLGQVGEGLKYLRHNLPQERLGVAVSSMAAARRTFDRALAYACERTAFGQPIADFQANRFYLAELATELEIGQCFVDRCILDASHGTLDAVTAAMAKWWITEMQQRVVQRAVQLHGGYGFMSEYDVAQDYLDCRAAPIYAGTTEIMKEIIGRKLTAAPR